MGRLGLDGKGWSRVLQGLVGLGRRWSGPVGLWPDRPDWTARQKYFIVLILFVIHFCKYLLDKYNI